MTTLAERALRYDREHARNLRALPATCSARTFCLDMHVVRPGKVAKVGQREVVGR